MPAAGAVSRGGGGLSASSIPRSDLLGAPGAEPRRRVRPASPGGTRPGGSRRESNRTDVHRRRGGRERRVGRARPARPRLRDAVHLARARRRLPARRGLHHGGAPLRPARQPACHDRAWPVRALPPGGAAEAPARPRRARPRADRLRRLPGCGRRHRVARARGPAPDSRTARPSICPGASPCWGPTIRAARTRRRGRLTWPMFEAVFAEARRRLGPGASRLRPDGPSRRARAPG